MKLQTSIVLLYLIVAASSTNIFQEQYKMLGKIKSFLPHNTYNYNHYKNYANNIQTSVDLFKDTVTHADRDKVIQRYQFPAEIMKGFQSAFMSKEGQIIELINFVKPSINSNGTSTYMRLIGYAEKIDQVVAFVVAKAYTTCGFVQKKQMYRREYCSGWWIFESCELINEWRDRGYNANELKQLSTALDVHNQVTIKSKIDSINPTDIPGQSRLYSASRRYSIRVKPNGFVAIYDYNSEKGGFGKTYNVRDGPFSFRVKQNGDIVIQNDRGQIFWSANTAGKGKFPYTMILTEDQNIVVIDSTNKPIWDKENKYSHRNCLMIQGYKLLSDNKKYYAEVQNGAIHVFQKGSNKVVSQVGISSKGYFYAYLEDDGKLVITNYDSTIYSKPGYGAKGEYRFKVTNEGKLAIVNGAGNAVFTSQ